MAITDNSFNGQELAAAITANPNLLGEVKTYLTGTNYVVRSTDEETAYSSNLRNTYDSDFIRNNNIKLEANQTVSDYLNGLSTQNSTLAEEIKTLKGATNLSKVERDRLELLQNTVTDLNKKLSEKDTAISIAAVRNTVLSEIGTSQGKLMKSDIPGVSSAINLYSEKVISDILKMSVKDERTGKIVLEGEDKKTIIKADGFPQTTSEYYEAEMNKAGFMDTGKTGIGAGGSGIGEKIGSIPADIKTKAKLMDYLRDGPMKGKSEKELYTEYNKYQASFAS